jgi:hypothetical protein
MPPLASGGLAYQQSPRTEHGTHTVPREDSWATFIGNVAAFFGTPAGIEAGATVLLTAITGLLAYIAFQQHATNRAQLRAYVFVEDAMITAPILQADWTITYRLKNAGPTPAHKVRSIDTIGVETWEPTKLPVPAEGDYHGSLAPNGDFIDTEELSLKLSLEENRAVTSNDGTKAIFLTGQITYVDVFRRTHKTNFCFYWRGRIGDKAVQMTAYDKGNDSD